MVKSIFGHHGMTRAAVISFAFLLGSATGCGGADKQPVVQPVMQQAPVLAATLIAGNARSAARYTVIQLGSGGLDELDINAHGQVAFSLFRDSATHAGFFDGNTIKDINSRGVNSVYATALNRRGQIAGHYEPGPGADFRAFRWTEAGGLRDLGTLGKSRGGYSQARAINASGQVAGFSSDASAPGPHAFIWDDAHGMVDIGTLAGSWSMARAINDDGVVVGNSISVSGEPHAFRWTSAGGMVDLGTIGGIDSNATHINNAGQIAGSASAPGRPEDNHGFVWTADTGMADIGTLGGARSGVNAMNQAGEVAGFAVNACGNAHAILWTRQGGIVDLYPSCGSMSSAFGINKAGDIVGVWSLTGDVSDYRAFLWTEKEGLVDLNDVLLNAPPGLILTQAMAISDKGEIVAYSNAGLVLLKL